MIEIYINKEQLELSEEPNIRMNNLVYDPTSLTYAQAEYSFEITVPSTPTNDRIFNYANNLSKLNKFNIRYDAQLIAEGTKIFDGQAVLRSYKNKEYTFNFIAIKVYSLEDIFGDSLLKDIDWKVDFSGVTSINSANTNDNGEYYFPLVSYGVFQKKPSVKDQYDSTYDIYTSKFVIDNYNKWWVESFPPSHNMLTTLKKCFEHKGYTVGGDAFNDPVLKNIYMSVNLADGQSPDYNVGNPLFGDLQISSTFNNADKSAYMGVQDLKFKYRKVEYYANGEFMDEFNFPSIDYWNMYDNNVSTKTMGHNSYMFDPDEQLIVIPADGFYRISLNANMVLSNPSSTFKAYQYVGNPYNGKPLEEKEISLTTSLKDETPIEIQLVKNYEDDIELIKGKENRRYRDGNPNNNIVTNKYYTRVDGIIVETAEDYSLPNRMDWITCYPHQELGDAENPTIDETIGRPTYDSYVYQRNETLAYDPIVSTKFICGLSSMSNGVPAVLKNGKGWSNQNGEVNEVVANVRGYNRLLTTTRPDGSQQSMEIPSSLNQNTFPQAPNNRCSASDYQLNGSVTCTVYLKKNDVLQLMLIQRDFSGEQKYSVSGTTNLHIEAVSPLSKKNDLMATNYNYNTPTTFDDKLNLTNWFNQDTTMQQFASDVINALNLQLIQDGKNIFLDKKKKVVNNQYINYAVDIDDRINSYEDDVESENIDYPQTLAVKYKIDEDSWGFERSVTPQSKLNDDDWKDYADSGYTVVILNDSIYADKKEEISTNFSYTWYDTFNKNGTFLNIPVISKYSYMIDGYSYAESMKHDGYGQTQRMWFRQPVSRISVNTASLPQETIYLSLPINTYKGVNLSYKGTENSLLTNYFNLAPTVEANMLSINVRLTPKEYYEVKNGAMVHMDADLYLVSEVVGYDPSSGYCELKLIKKVV